MTFAQFYAEYPRKVGKKDAEKAWKALKVTQLIGDHIHAVLEKRKREDWRGREVRFIPYPAHFLRAECFDDEVEAQADDPVPTPHVHICRVCLFAHEWTHDEPLCGMSKEVACSEAVAAIRKRRANA